MPRNLTTGVIQQLEATQVRPVLLVSLAFADNTVYAWTGVGSISWNGHTWLGVGELGSVSTISEGSEVQANGITLTLTGIPTDLLNEGLNEVVAGKMAQVYLGFMDNAGNLIPDPIPAFIGMLDQPTINIGTETSTISITAENRLVDMNRARGSRYTDQDQRAKYPDDGCLKYVHFLMDSHYIWK